MSLQYIQPGARMSGAVKANGFVFLSGQVADDTSASVTGQTEQILAKIDSILAEAGTSADCRRSFCVSRLNRVSSRGSAIRISRGNPGKASRSKLCGTKAMPRPRCTMSNRGKVFIPQ